MGIELIAWSECALPDLIAWSGFGVAPVDEIVMNVLVLEMLGRVISTRDDKSSNNMAS